MSKRRKIPTELRILGKPYRVEVEHEGDMQFRDIGHANHLKQLIALQDGQAEEQQRDTLLHEVIHAVEFSMCLSLEERQVHALACGLLSVLRDNPGFAEWLVE